MEEQKFEKYLSEAAEYHKNGYSCAESVLHTFRDKLPFTLSDETMRIATCFGGQAVGESGFCGAFTGSIMVLSLLVGRSSTQQSKETAQAYSREFGTRFVNQFGSNACKPLQIHVYGSPEQKANCRRITSTAACMMAEFLAEKNLLPAPAVGGQSPESKR